MIHFTRNPLALSITMIAECSTRSKAFVESSLRTMIFSKSHLRTMISLLECWHWWRYSKPIPILNSSTFYKTRFSWTRLRTTFWRQLERSFVMIFIEVFRERERSEVIDGLRVFLLRNNGDIRGIDTLDVSQVVKNTGIDYKSHI